MTISLRTKLLATIALACWSTSSVVADPIDLTSWSTAGYGSGFGGVNAPSWELYDAFTGDPAGTTEANQERGGAWTSILLSDFSLTHAATPGISGTLGLATTVDDDQIGLVFGYQDLEHLYLFQWKRGGSIDCATTNVRRGMTIRRVDVQPATPLTEADLEWCGDTVNSTILAENDTRWFTDTIYDYSVTFLPTGFRFTLRDGATVLADWVINDTTYTSGNVGFYNSSQADSRYTMNQVTSDVRVELVEVALGSSTGTLLANASGARRGFYDLADQTMLMDVGALNLQFDIDQNPGNELFDHTLTDAAWDLQAGTFGVTSFDCAEGTYGAGVGEFLCAGTGFGVNTTNDSTTDYSTVPGTRVIGGDDTDIRPQLQASDYAALQTSWDGSTLVAETPAWTASPGLAGYRLTFSVLVPNPMPVALALARFGTPAGVDEAMPAGQIRAVYDSGLDSVAMNGGTMTIPYVTSAPTGETTVTHTLVSALWDLESGQVTYAGFDCAEGAYGAVVNQFLCANTDYGLNLTNETTTDYVAEPATRVLGGDDAALGPQHQGSDYSANFVSWDGSTLILESPDWTANPDGAGGATAGYQLIFVAGGPPSVTITAPQAGTLSTESIPVNLAATANDGEDGDLSAQIQWSSDIDGVLTMPAQLSVGTHMLTASVMDSNGLTGFDTVAVTVVNAPVLTIDSPSDGSEFVDGAAIVLEGAAIDVEDGDISASIQWTSDLAGSLGSGAALPVNLVPGAHLITATVMDSNGHTPLVNPTVRLIVQQDADADGLPDVWETTFGVGDPLGDDDGDTVINVDEYNGGTNPLDSAPQVTIQAPVGGYTAAPNEFVNFAAAASDVEDGDISANVRWSSSLDGELGVGATLPVTLSLGTHLITATVTDSQGGSPPIAPAIQVTIELAATGDFNGDGVVDISDLLQLQQLLTTP
ncbi:MAG: hypothetical protein HKN81_06075 [Gammaproteobacteria bacterium]|nr:hypothetical protein [Gammaproteobacteria bacterium]